MENKYKVGKVVLERIRPGQKLVVSHYFDKLYYCKAQENSTRKELVYFERDLMADTALWADALTDALITHGVEEHPHKYLLETIDHSFHNDLHGLFRLHGGM